MSKTFIPPYIPLEQLHESLDQYGFAILNQESFLKFTGHPLHEWEATQWFWEHLDLDQYLKDGGKYRKRKHASVIATSSTFDIQPYRPHFQPVSYNALHGGMDRTFTSCDDAFLNNHALKDLIQHLADLFHQQDPETTNSKTPWFVEVHQFRIDVASGIGRPTPEGAHRDGVDYVAVLLLNRQGIKGGESRVFSVDGPSGQRFTLDTPWSLLILDDHQVLHETTPIQPYDKNKPQNSWRDTLVLTFRKNGFLTASITQ